MRIAAAAADLKLLLHLKKQGCAGNAGELAAQPVDHHVAGYALAFVRWLEGDEHVSNVGAAAAWPVAAHKGCHR